MIRTWGRIKRASSVGENMADKARHMKIVASELLRNGKRHSAGYGYVDPKGNYGSWSRGYYPAITAEVRK